MSGLYNMLFGYNLFAGFLLTVLELDYDKVPRFRDCFLNKAGTEIIVFTRVGGGNRADYEEGITMMRQVPGYLRDEDDHYDNTYAAFFYGVPEDYKEHCLAIVEMGGGVDMKARWQEAMDIIKNMKPPDV